MPSRESDLRERASKSFDARFRAKLADACQAHLDSIRPVGLSNSIPDSGICFCPEGAIIERIPRPGPGTCEDELGFTSEKHSAFQVAFDYGIDRDTPESALGLLYRERFRR